MEKQIYNLTKEEVFEKFSCSKDGLSGNEAQKRLKQNGANAVKKKASFSWFSILLHQFDDALIWILLVAGVLSLTFGEVHDTVIIFAIVFINSLIGFSQEFRAEKTLDNIRNLVLTKAIVLRDGQQVEIDASFLVLGDVIFLDSGDTVPADCYLLESYDVFANEFIFTGESKPKKKKAEVVLEENASLAERTNIMLAGTSVTRGTAVAMVIAVAMDTQLGHIANLVKEVSDDETPLQKQLRILGRDVSIAAIIIGGLVLIVGRHYGLSWYGSFLFGLALAVSVVPNGLPAAMSVALSLGMRRLLKKNVLAKKLNSVETLASVNIICTDKTGTITRNELMVTNVICGDDEFTVDGEGYQDKGSFYSFGREVDVKQNIALENLLRIGVVCNDAALAEKDGIFSITGDPTEGALLVVAKKYQKKLGFFHEGLEKINENPFSSERMRMNVVCRDGATGKVMSFVKGSPDVLLDLCTHKQLGEKIIPFTQEEKQKAKNSYDVMSKQALRVLAFASRDITNTNPEDYLKQSDQELIWMGMMGMIDPPRTDVHKAIDDCIRSGIKVVMITGDYEVTAEAIARKVGLLRSPRSMVINGKLLDQMTDDQLAEIIQENEVVFARIAPEQKLRIATVLKNYGAVIAMTGDGVNDAPALKKADIGVAMGIIGTDVAKEAADMILLDDNFASIVSVIKESRTIYQNLKKFVYYVFVANAGELLTVALGVLLQLPAPIIAVQILAIDLGTDVFPSFALSLEPSEPGIMKRKPFDSRERVIDQQGVARIIKVGIIMATGAIVAFILSMERGGWHFGNKIDAGSVLYMRSTTVVYAVLSVSQIANLFQARSETLSVFVIGFFKNKFAIAAAVISFAILIFVMYASVAQKYLRTVPISWKDWLAVAITALAIFIYEEGRKAEHTQNYE